MKLRRVALSMKSIGYMFQTKTKTGERIVIPLHTHWVDLFDLRNEKPYDKGISAMDAC